MMMMMMMMMMNRVYLLSIIFSILYFLLFTCLLFSSFPIIIVICFLPVFFFPSLSFLLHRYHTTPSILFLLFFLCLLFLLPFVLVVRSFPISLSIFRIFFASRSPFWSTCRRVVWLMISHHHGVSLGVFRVLSQPFSGEPEENMEESEASQ